MRRENGQHPPLPSSHNFQQSIPSPLSSTGSSIPVDRSSSQQSVQDNYWGDQDESATSSSLGQNVPLSADLDFDLIWPDSEQLFESLMALESINPRQMSGGALPVSNLSQSLGNSTVSGSGSFHNISPLNGVVSAGESHQAVHNVSEMVTALVSILLKTLLKVFRLSAYSRPT